MTTSRNWLARGSAIVLLLALVLGAAWVVYVNAQAASESGPDLGAPSLVPVTPGQTSSSPRTVASQTVQPVLGVPTRLIIPSIGVNAPVIQVGAVKNGPQDVPGTFTDTGWWPGSSLVGAPGNTVIDGHTWSQGDGVFDKLPQLKVGAAIKVRTVKGTLVYRVVSVGSILQSKFDQVAPKVYAQTGPTGLVLMTCGDFQAATHSYDRTTIVYAEPSAPLS